VLLLLPLDAKVRRNVGQLILAHIGLCLAGVGSVVLPPMPSPTHTHSIHRLSAPQLVPQLASAATAASPTGCNSRHHSLSHGLHQPPPQSLPPCLLTVNSAHVCIGPGSAPPAPRILPTSAPAWRSAPTASARTAAVALAKPCECQRWHPCRHRRHRTAQCPRVRHPLFATSFAETAVCLVDRPTFCP